MSLFILYTAPLFSLLNPRFRQTLFMPYHVQHPSSSHTAPQPYIVLAPMHGYADEIMRRILTEIGGFDEVVSEFVRITHTVHSRKTWLKHAPELAHHARTAAGVPCTVQLLGSDAEKMAENAQVAVACGARKIDLNFGCPAPTVNRHQGGAVLLQAPHRIEQIVRTVREALPADIVLSAKMRLGYENTTQAIACAQAIAAGGAALITVHARTKVEAYTPPAHWQWFAPIQAAVDIPLIANGDIFSVADFIQIQEMASPYGVMLGRGALMRPDLARQIRAYTSGQIPEPMDTAQIRTLLGHFFTLCRAKDEQGKYALSRLKQWLPLLCTNYPELNALLTAIRPLTSADKVAHLLQQAI